MLFVNAALLSVTSHCWIGFSFAVNLDFMNRKFVLFDVPSDVFIQIVVLLLLISIYFVYSGVECHSVFLDTTLR